MEACQRHLDQLKSVIRHENQEAIQVMVKQGVKMVTPSKEQIEEFKRLSIKPSSHIRGPSFSKKIVDRGDFRAGELSEGGEMMHPGNGWMKSSAAWNISFSSFC